jgi:hypothetical protein
MPYVPNGRRRRRRRRRRLYWPADNSSFDHYLKHKCKILKPFLALKIMSENPKPFYGISL